MNQLYCKSTAVSSDLFPMEPIEVEWKHAVSLDDCGSIQLYGEAYLIWTSRNSTLYTKCARHSRSQLSHYAEMISDDKMSIMILISTPQAQYYEFILRSLWVNYSSHGILCGIAWFSFDYLCTWLKSVRYASGFWVSWMEKKCDGVKFNVSWCISNLFFVFLTWKKVRSSSWVPVSMLQLQDRWERLLLHIKVGL